MNSVARVRKSLRAPIKKMAGCVSGMKKRRLGARNKWGRGVGGRGGCPRLGRTPPLRTPHPKDPLIIRSYQADLEKERKLREDMNAQRNAQRAAMRAHFRRKYQLSENPKDTNHLRSVGERVSLPHELSKIIHPETKPKDSGFSLLSAFQGLSFSTAAHSKAPTPTAARGDSCKLM